MVFANADYIILEAPDPERLAQLVKELHQQKYYPQGGVAVAAIGDDNYIYAQAMTFNMEQQ